MTFINGSLAWGLLAVSLPILIHILNRQKFRPLNWAAMTLLKRSLEKSRRRIKMQEWLLLFLRCLAVFLLVCFLMRPVPGNFDWGERNRLRVLVLDHSASMAARRTGESAWSRALAAAREVVKASKPKEGDRFMVFSFGETIQLELAATHDTQAVFETLDSLKQTHRASRYEGLSQTILERIDEVDASTREIFVFSDFQATSLATTPFPIAETDRETWWHFHDSGEKERRNVAVAGMRILSSQVVKDRPVEIEVDVTNFSSEKSQVSVSLFEGPNKRSTQTGIDLPAGASSLITFTHTFTEEGPHYLRAMTEADPLAVDNNYWLGLNVQDRARVVIVDGDPGRVNYLDESFLFRNMLAIPETFDIHVFKQGVDSVEAIDFNHLQLLVLANVSNLPLPFLEKIKAWVSQGGSLFISGGSHITESSFQTLEELLPVTLETPLELSPPLPATQAPGQHPEQQMLNSFNTLERSEIRKTNQVKEKENARVILRAGRTYPLLIHRNYEKGQVMFWSSSLDWDWCSFSEPDYIFIFGRMAQVLVQSVWAQETHPGQELELFFPTVAVGGDARLKNSTPLEEENLLPNRRRTLATREDGLTTRVLLSGDFIKTSGVYEVLGRGGNTLSYVGVNTQTVESDLTPLKDEELLGANPNSYLSLSRTPQDLIAHLSGPVVGREIWRYLAMAALLCLALESYLAMRWGNR